MQLLCHPIDIIISISKCSSKKREEKDDEYIFSSKNIMPAFLECFDDISRMMYSFTCSVSWIGK